MSAEGWDISFQPGSIPQEYTPTHTGHDIPSPTIREERPVKSRRVRPTLSCTECKRRKIKCDRQIPCQSCVQRKRAHKCELSITRDVTSEGIARASLNARDAAQQQLSEKVDTSGQPTVDTEDAARVLEQLAGRAPKFGKSISGSQQASDTPLNLSRLSSTKTSIAALACHPRPQYLEPFTLAIPHLSPHRPPVYPINKIWTVIPDHNVLKFLYQSYWNESDLTCSVLYQPILHKEYEEFWKIVQVNPNFEIDPAWVAILLMLCALGYLRSDTILDESREKPKMDPHLPFNLYEAALLALKHADWSRRPQFRSVQTIALFTIYLKECGHFFTSEWFAWVAAGLRLSQTLGYHNLGSNPEVMPREDPALPPGPNGQKRELVKRLWWYFVSQDRSQSIVPKHTSFACPTEFNTNMPLNLNNNDLSPTEIARFGKPEYVLTDTSNHILAIYLLDWQKDLIDHETRRELTYEKVIEFERRLRDLESRALATLDTFNIMDKDVGARMFGRRCIAKSAIHKRISRLHLPYLFRGYTDKKYELSKNTCILSARTVIVSHWQLYEAFKTWRWNASAHILSAALILFVDIFLALEHQVSADELNEKVDTLRKACQLVDIAYKHVNSLLRNSEKMARHLMFQLMKEFEQQNELYADASSALGKGQPKRVEPIWAIFKRVTESMGSNLALNNNGLQTPACTSNGGVSVATDVSDEGGDVTESRATYMGGENPTSTVSEHEDTIIGGSLDLTNIEATTNGDGTEANNNLLGDNNINNSNPILAGVVNNQWMESSLVDFINELNGDVNPFGTGLDWGEYNNGTFL